MQLCLGVVTLVCFERLSIRLDAGREIPPEARRFWGSIRPAQQADPAGDGTRHVGRALRRRHGSAADFAIGVLRVGAQGFGFGFVPLRPSEPFPWLASTGSHQNHKTGRVLLWSVAGFGVATVVFGFSRSFGLSFAALVAIGAMDNISVVLRQSLLQMVAGSARPECWR